MATQRQIEANRLNAQLSTGPRTQEGKDRSRGNALTHGLTAETVALDFSAARADAKELRKQNWGREFRPETAQAEYALDRAVAASFRIEDCEDALDTAADEHAARARMGWDIDARNHAATLADRLSKRPILIAAQLESTPHGADLKIAMWDALASSIEVNGTWTDAEASMALDLLGVSTALRSGRTPIDIRGGDLAAHRLALANRERSRLIELKAETLEPLDALHRKQAERIAAALVTPTAALLLRYERDAWRRLREAMRDARQRPEPAAEPEPEPEIKIERAPSPHMRTLVSDLELRQAAIQKYHAEALIRARSMTVEERDALMIEMRQTTARLVDRSIPLEQ